MTRVLVLLAALLAVLPSCQVSPSGQAGADRSGRQAQPPRQVPPPAIAAIRSEPDVRVRVVVSTPRVSVHARSPLTIGPLQANLSRPRLFDPPVTISRSGGTFVIADRGGNAVAWGVPALRITSASGGDQLLSVNDTAYPGAVVLHPSGRSDDRLDVVNHVPMEQYLPGVIERELFPRWEPAAFAAQAIAARSYAIAHQAVNAERPWDLESTVASQVYGGAARNATAIRAVQQTRGQVLTYAGRVVPAFFSSCSGGYGQSATIAFPDQKLDVNIAPLQGRTHPWGRSSNYYRWGPFSRDTADLSRRMAAWGRANDHPVAELGTITGVDVPQRSPTGRPAAFRVQDHRRQTFTLAPEHFRFACNYAGGGLAAVPTAAQVRSSHVDVTVRGTTVLFSNGHGYGHGVGLDQWGAQEMALAGHTAHQIVTFFYPGAAVERLY